MEVIWFYCHSSPKLPARIRMNKCLIRCNLSICYRYFCVVIRFIATEVMFKCSIPLTSWWISDYMVKFFCGRNLMFLELVMIFCEPDPHRYTFISVEALILLCYQTKYLLLMFMFWFSFVFMWGTMRLGLLCLFFQQYFWGSFSKA